VSLRRRTPECRTSQRTACLDIRTGPRLVLHLVGAPYECGLMQTGVSFAGTSVDFTCSRQVAETPGFAEQLLACAADPPPDARNVRSGHGVE
ncbi:MAG: hypothetical protein KDB20_10910, partial [Microthrixaceae bacterium]|nr:hypothetical protein [Microthrixaceae bacterium]